jgi:hypothetical protein
VVSRFLVPFVLAAFVAVPEAHAAPDAKKDALDEAKVLYQEAEGLAASGQWPEAVVKYEQAYYLVPDKHGFALKIGEAAFEAGDCTKAERYARHFIKYAPQDKQETDGPRAYDVLNKIEYTNCAATDEAPPPVEKKGCQIGDDAPAPASLGVLLALLWGRRRSGEAQSESPNRAPS